MARIFATTADKLTAASPAITASPLSMSCWYNATSLASNPLMVTLGVSGSAFNRYSLGCEFNGTKASSAQTAGGAAVVQALTSTTIATGAWHSFSGSWTSNIARAAYLDGGGKGTNTSNQGPAGVNQMFVSGRPSDGSGAMVGKLAHVALWSRILGDIEHLYLGSGGHVRALSPDLYYRLNQNASPEVADVGTFNLTVTGTTFSNADSPVVATYYTGTSLTDQIFTQGTPTGGINLDNFEDVSSAYTVSLYNLGSSGGTTTATALGSSATTVPLTSATGFVAGDYLTAGASAKTLILAVSGLNVLVRDAITWSNGATVTHFPATAATIAGLSVSGGTLMGTPTGTQALTSNYLSRAINNTTSTLIADSNLFAITVNAGASGGGGTGTGFPPAKRNRYIYYDVYYPR